MIYSPLTNQVQITKNCSSRGNNKIERITPHCIVGQARAIDIARSKKFNDGKTASANYIIGKDGEVVCNVPEDLRAWTSGGEKKVNGKTGRDNDFKAITFECASDTKEPYAFKQVVWDKLVLMCVDICKRYGRTKLLWFATPQEAESYVVKADEMILTWHRWYAYKSCPGNYCYSRGQLLADTVTKQLGGIIVTPTTPTVETEEYNMPTIKKGSKGKAVKIWQVIVGVDADGIFGSGTEKATKNWQKTHKDKYGNKLVSDGIVGPLTWKAGFDSLV